MTARTAIVALAALNVVAWSAWFFTGQLEQSATAWAPPVPDAEAPAPTPGSSRLVYDQERTDDGWLGWVGGTDVDAVDCGHGPAKEEIAREMASGVCESGEAREVNVLRLDTRSDSGHCVTEVRLAVRCTG